MWIWREDRENTAGGAFDHDGRTRGGWHLDAYGAWTWSERAGGLDDRIAVGAPMSMAAASSTSMSPEAGASALALLPSPAAPGDSWIGAEPGAGSWPGSWADETPIFHAVSDDHSRRAQLRPVGNETGDGPWAAIPDPSPGSGPIPIQHGAGQDGSERRRAGHLMSVPTVPPPSGDDDVVTGSSSPEDELRRRAERRRRPQRSESARGSGRHAMRDERAVAPRTGRHSLEV